MLFIIEKPTIEVQRSKLHIVSYLFYYAVFTPYLAPIHHNIIIDKQS